MTSKVTIGPDRILHVNGKPFFPIGARHMPLGATPSLLKKAGFNCMRWVAFGGDGMTLPVASLPKDLGGLMFYPYVFDRGDLSRDAKRRRKDLEALVRKVRNHPALLCYEQRNEPASIWRDSARPQSPPKGLIAGSQVIRDLDPNHPIRVGHLVSNLVSTLRKFNPAMDIVGCNPYVLIEPGQRLFVGARQDGKLVDCPNQTLSGVGELTTKMMRVAEGRPVWMQIQAMANEDWFSLFHTPENRNSCRYEHTRLIPTRWQCRFMTFNAIIRGATGLEFAMFKLSANEPAWIGVREVIGELRDLHDVLASPIWNGTMQIDYRELGFGDWTGVETLVKLHRGRPWILAANTQFDPMEATFSNLPEGIGEMLEVFGENRAVTVKAGRFTDYFRPYEVHVYAAQEASGSGLSGSHLTVGGDEP